MEELTDKDLSKIVQLVNSYIEDAKKLDYDMGAVNWGDIRCADIIYEYSLFNDTETLVVLIEEASPTCALTGYVEARLFEDGFNAEVRAEW